jgi:putative oxidoreductase
MGGNMISKLDRLYTNFVTGWGALSLLVLRVVVGAAFMLHGWPKIQNPMGWMGPGAPIPGIFQALAAVSEFIGGLFWILGLLTPIASFGILCTMSVAFWTHYSKGDPFVGRGGGSYELALVYLAVSLVLMFRGPGKISFDGFIFGRNRSRGARKLALR